MADNKKEMERAELHKTIWGIADEMRGSVDGWDFKSYILGMLFYRYISENITNYINKGEWDADNTDFNYADLDDATAEDAREEMVSVKGFFILPSQLFCNICKNCDKDDNLNETLNLQKTGSIKVTFYIVIMNNKLTYSDSFDEIIRMIQQTRSNVIRAANSAMVDLYWHVGEYVSHKIDAAEWGDSVVEQLATYISKKHPDIKGFSDKNIWRMKQFYETYAKSNVKLSPLVRQLSWTNNLLLLSRTKTMDEKAFYLQLCINERLSKRELNRQIDNGLYERTRLDSPKLSSVLREMVPEAEQVFRDNYVMEFITGKESKPENALRKALIQKMKDFILELGKDFIYIDEEYHLQVGNSDFRIDLLFYHRELQCLVAFELKTEAFKPEHLGQLNFYLEALDRDVKKAKENPSIGVLLCKDKDDEVVEYALSRSLSPTMVAEYQLCLPDKKMLQRKMHEIAYSEEANDDDKKEK